jgi:hypothetical protein
MKNETHFGGGSNTFFSTNTLLLTTNIYIWSMKTVTTYLYKAPQPHRHSIGLTAKKFRNVSLSDAQLGNQALLASYFSLKPNLLISQEGHIATQMRVLTRQEGHIANRMPLLIAQEGHLLHRMALLIDQERHIANKMAFPIAQEGHLLHQMALLRCDLPVFPLKN